MTVNDFRYRVQNGLTYKEYSDLINNGIINVDPLLLDADEKNIYDRKKLNIQRVSRIEKTYKVSDELRSVIQSIEDKQLWLIISEEGCGDSAQTLPYIAAMAAENSKIGIKVLLRDDNVDIMDMYLTNGYRSIPKLIAFDTEWNELFVWGPRPRTAGMLIKQLKSEGIVAPELYERLHLWYGRNRGKDLEAEFIDILSKTVHV